MGLRTQQARSLHTIAFAFFTLPFFSSNPPSPCPFCQLCYNGVTFSQVTDDDIFNNREPASIRTACVGSWLCNTGLSQGNCVAPDLPGLRAQMGGEAQPRCRYFSCSSHRPNDGSKVEGVRKIKIRLSSPRFSARTPSRVSFDGTA